MKISRHLCSAYVVYTTAKQVRSRHRLDENNCETYKNEKRACKACKSIDSSLLNMQICDVLVGVVAGGCTYANDTKSLNWRSP